MELFFSGASGAQEIRMLRDAGIRRYLFDVYDYQRQLKSIRELKTELGSSIRLMLDSGAYREFKSRTQFVSHQDYKALAETSAFSFRVAKDVIGDPEQTMQNWLDHYSPARTLWSFVPVWEFGAPREHLEFYLQEAEVVGIGGLVPSMRGKDEAMLRELKRLCKKNPGRFHLFGANWLKALNHLRDSIRSADTSKFLDGGRYGHVVFKHEKNGHLSQTPAKILGFGHLSRQDRCVESARAIREYCEPEVATQD